MSMVKSSSNTLADRHTKNNQQLGWKCAVIATLSPEDDHLVVVEVDNSTVN